MSFGYEFLTVSKLREASWSFVRREDTEEMKRREPTTALQSLAPVGPWGGGAAQQSTVMQWPLPLCWVSPSNCSNLLYAPVIDEIPARTSAWERMGQLLGRAERTKKGETVKFIHFCSLHCFSRCVGLSSYLGTLGTH